MGTKRTEYSNSLQLTAARCVTMTYAKVTACYLLKLKLSAKIAFRIAKETKSDIENLAHGMISNDNKLHSALRRAHTASLNQYQLALQTNRVWT